MPLLHQAQRILIRCPNWIGDAVAATPVVRCLRQNYPRAHITLLLEPYVRAVYRHAPWHNNVIEFDKQRGRVRETLRVARTLRQPPQYDLALLLTHSFSAALLLRLGRVRVRVGHAREGRSRLLTDPVPWPGTGQDTKLIPKVRLYQSLLRRLGCEHADDMRPQLFTSLEEEVRADQLLAAHHRDPGKRLLAVVPGAAFGSSKLWEPSRFAVVADMLAERHAMQPLILTGPGEADIGRAIVKEMRATAISFAEGEITFGLLKALVRRSALMVCNDTGPRHVAIAYQLPVVTLMGPTDPAVTHSDYEKTAIVRCDVPCGPCYKRTCPTDHKCMKLITPEMVLAAAEDLLRRFGPHEPES